MLAHHGDDEVRPATVADYRRNLEADAIPYFGKRPLAAIGPRDVKALVRHVAGRGIAYNRIRLAFAPVRALFATALEDELIQRNPTLGIRIPRLDVTPEDRQARALTPAELKKLLAAIPEDHRLIGSSSASSPRLGSGSPRPRRCAGRTSTASATG